MGFGRGPVFGQTQWSDIAATPGGDVVAGRPLDCVEVVELVTDYLEGALDPSTAAAVEVHLATCAGCLEYLTQVRWTADRIGEPAADSLPETVRASLVDAFREWAGRWPPTSV